MKKLVYLLSLVLVATLFSCEEENVEPDPVDEGIITLAELDGYWEFQYYEYEGEQYGCYTLNDNTIYDQINDDLVYDWDIDVEEMIIKFYSPCSDIEGNREFSKNYNEIKTNLYNFTIINYNNGILKLRFDEKIYYDYNYLGGTLVLKKQ